MAKTNLITLTDIKNLHRYVEKKLLHETQKIAR